MLLFSVALIAGCGGPARPPGLPNLHECVLTFQFEDGSPVSGASVSLRPEDTALEQWSITGKTDSAGSARIYTNADFPGAPAGKYKILIQKSEQVETGGTDEYGDPIREVRNMVNEKYGSGSSTLLSLDVQKAVKETFKVEK